MVVPAVALPISPVEARCLGAFGHGGGAKGAERDAHGAPLKKRGAENALALMRIMKTERKMG